jgi:hypothetical protein
MGDVKKPAKLGRPAPMTQFEEHLKLVAPSERTRLANIIMEADNTSFDGLAALSKQLKAEVVLGTLGAATAEILLDLLKFDFVLLNAKAPAKAQNSTNSVTVNVLNALKTAPQPKQVLAAQDYKPMIVAPLDDDRLTPEEEKAELIIEAYQEPE